MCMTTNPQSGPDLDEAIALALGCERLKDNGVPYFIYNGAEYRHVSEEDRFALGLLQQLCKPKEEGGRGWAGFRTWHNSHDDEFSNGVIIIDAAYNDYCGTSVVSFAHAAALAIRPALEAEK